MIYKREPIRHQLPANWQKTDAVNVLNMINFKGIQSYDNPLLADIMSMYDGKNVYVDENGSMTIRPSILAEHEFFDSDVRKIFETPIGQIRLYSNQISYPDGENSYIGSDILPDSDITVQVTADNSVYVLYTRPSGKLMLAKWSDGELEDVTGDILLAESLDLATSEQLSKFNILNDKIYTQYTPGLYDAPYINETSGLELINTQTVVTTETPIIKRWLEHSFGKNKIVAIIFDNADGTYLTTFVLSDNILDWNVKTTRIGDELLVGRQFDSNTPSMDNCVFLAVNDTLELRITSIDASGTLYANLYTFAFDGTLINQRSANCIIENALITGIDTQQKYSTALIYDKATNSHNVIISSLKWGSGEYSDELYTNFYSISLSYLETLDSDDVVKMTSEYVENLDIEINGNYISKYNDDMITTVTISTPHYLNNAITNILDTPKIYYILPSIKYCREIDYIINNTSIFCHIQQTTNTGATISRVLNCDVSKITKTDKVINITSDDILSFDINSIVPDFDAALYGLYYTDTLYLNYKYNDRLNTLRFTQEDNILTGIIYDNGKYEDFVKIDTNQNYLNTQLLVFTNKNPFDFRINLNADNNIEIQNFEFKTIRTEYPRPTNSIPVLKDIEDEVITSFFLDGYYWFITKHHIFGTGAGVNGDLTIEFFDPRKYFNITEDITAAIRMSDTSFWIFHNDGAYLIYKSSNLYYPDENLPGLYLWHITPTAKSKGCDFKNGLITLPVTSNITTVTAVDICSIQLPENIQSDERLLVPLTAELQKFVSDILLETSSVVLCNYKYLTLYCLNRKVESDTTPILVYDNLRKFWWYWELPVNQIRQSLPSENNVRLLCKIGEECQIVGFSEDYFRYSIGLLEYNIYADKVYENSEQRVKQIAWSWTSAIQPFGAINYRKQLLETTFMLHDYNMLRGDKFESQEQNFAYRYHIYSREHSLTAQQSSEKNVTRSEHMTYKSVIGNFTYLQILLKNQLANTDELTDTLQLMTKPKFTGIALKYRVLSGGLT